MSVVAAAITRQPCLPVWVEALVEGLALLCHIDQQSRCLELLAIFARQHLAHVDKGLRPHGVDVAQCTTGVGRKPEAQDGADIGLARIGDDAFFHCTRSFKGNRRQVAVLQFLNVDLGRVLLRIECLQLGPQVLLAGLAG